MSFNESPVQMEFYVNSVDKARLVNRIKEEKKDKKKIYEYT